jgi:hypothetical protein
MTSPQLTAGGKSKTTVDTALTATAVNAEEEVTSAPVAISRFKQNYMRKNED